MGPFGLFQAVADILKLLLKEDVVPMYADRLLHTLAPLILLVPSMTTFAVIPLARRFTSSGATSRSWSRT